MKVLNKIIAILMDRGDVEMVIRPGRVYGKRSVEFMLCDFNGQERRRITRMFTLEELDGLVDAAGFLNNHIEQMKQELWGKK